MKRVVSKSIFAVLVYYVKIIVSPIKVTAGFKILINLFKERVIV